MKSFQQKDCFAAIPGKSFFFPTMHEFINRITVNLEFHLKMHLYNIFPFPAQESKQGSFIPIPSAKWPVPEGSSARGPPPAVPPRVGHQGSGLICTKLAPCLVYKANVASQHHRSLVLKMREISLHTTMLLGSMDSTASRNLNCTCWYSRWCSNVKYCTPLLVSTSCMAIPRERTDVGTAGASLKARAAETLLLSCNIESLYALLAPQLGVFSETPTDFHYFTSFHKPTCETHSRSPDSSLSL